MLHRVLALVAAATTLTAAPAAAATTCTATALPMPPGGTDSHVSATNGAGVYAGTVSFSSTSSKGAVWRDGGVTVLDEWFSPTAMNAAGLMSGQASAGNGRTRAAVWPLDGALAPLAEADSSARDVNAAGDVVGVGPVYRGSVGVLWQAPTHAAQGLTPYGYGSADAIDDDGWLLGEYSYQGGPVTNYLWRLENGSVREVRQYSDTDLVDVDEGLVAATRGGQIVVIDAATGAATSVPGTQNARPIAIDDGVVIGAGPALSMWRDGETVVLPGIPGGRPWQLSTVNKGGTEITGNSVRDTGGTVATVWHCSP